MAVKRFVPSEIWGFKGVIIYQWQAAAVTAVDAFYELDSGEVFSQYKCGLIFIEITAITGTWSFSVQTSLRLSSTGAPHRHTVQNQLSVAGRTTTGVIEVGWNAYSGVNTLLAEKMELFVDNTAAGSVTFDADVIFYN